MKGNAIERKQFQVHLGELIRESRHAKGYNQEDLANMVGLSRVQIVNMEKGVNATSIYTYMKIQNILGFPHPSTDVRTYKKLQNSAKEERRKKKKADIDEKIKALQKLKKSI